MPTPNETITVISTISGGDISRPSRLQLACPEEPIAFRNSSSLSTWRQVSQQASAPPTMPQQQLSPITSSSDDETSTTTTVVKEVDRDVSSAEPSPTLEPKHHSQQPASHGLPLSLESPFVSSLSHEFSAKRVCYFAIPMLLNCETRDADCWPGSCYPPHLAHFCVQEVNSSESRPLTGQHTKSMWNSSMLT